MLLSAGEEDRKTALVRIAASLCDAAIALPAMILVKVDYLPFGKAELLGKSKKLFSLCRMARTQYRRCYSGVDGNFSGQWEELVPQATACRITGRKCHCISPYETRGQAILLPSQATS